MRPPRRARGRCCPKARGRRHISGPSWPGWTGTEGSGLVDGGMTADGAGAGGAAPGGTRGSDAVSEQEAQEIAGDLGGFVLARSEVDRASARREDPDWITAAWADG